MFQQKVHVNMRNLNEYGSLVFYLNKAVGAQNSLGGGGTRRICTNVQIKIFPNVLKKKRLH